MEKLVWNGKLIPPTQSWGLLTDAEGDIQQAHANIQAEEKNCIGHLTKHEDVAHVLFHSD